MGDELLVFVRAQRFRDELLLPSAGRTATHTTLHDALIIATPVTLLQLQDTLLSCRLFWEQSSLSQARDLLLYHASNPHLVYLACNRNRIFGSGARVLVSWPSPVGQSGD